MGFPIYTCVCFCNLTLSFLKPQIRGQQFRASSFPSPLEPTVLHQWFPLHPITFIYPLIWLFSHSLSICSYLPPTKNYDLPFNQVFLSPSLPNEAFVWRTAMLSSLLFPLNSSTHSNLAFLPITSLQLWLMKLLLASLLLNTIDLHKWVS